MQEYWDMISTRHQEKLLAVSKRKGVSLETAMRNIINYLKYDNAGGPEYLRELITAKHIEGTIDMIVN